MNCHLCKHSLFVPSHYLHDNGFAHSYTTPFHPMNTSHIRSSLLSSSVNNYVSSLSPHPAPPPPGGVTAMVTSGSSITVKWTPPTLPDNRPPVTGYTVTAVPSSGSTPVELPATATSTVLSGLQRGTVYTIKVVAKSVVGNSMPWSSTVDFSGKYASSVTLSEWTACVCDRVQTSVLL